MPDRRTIIILTAGGNFPWIVINAVAEAFDDVVVLKEHPESKVAFIRRKARLMGWVSAIGQLATMVTSKVGKGFTQISCIRADAQRSIWSYIFHNINPEKQ